MSEIAIDIFWWVAEQLRFLAHSVSPFLLLATAGVWVFRERTPASLSALAGGFLFAGAVFTHYLVPEVRGSSRSPSTDQNGLFYFFYIHGWWLGIAAFSGATLFHFMRWRNRV